MNVGFGMNTEAIPAESQTLEGGEGSDFGGQVLNFVPREIQSPQIGRYLSKLRRKLNNGCERLVGRDIFIDEF